MLKIGTVVAVYPEGHSIDVLLNNGDRLSNVQVLCATGSSDSGVVDLPDVGGPAPSDDARWDPTATRSRYVKALVDFADGVPVCMGFLLPQVNEITFKEKNRRVVRHASDWYTSVDASANFEAHHPSGTYVRIGVAPAHEDLSGKDFDGKWAIDNNTGATVHLQVTVANGGAVKASFNIDPSGNITLTHAGNLTVHTSGDASVQADGTAAVHSGGDATVQVGGKTALMSTGNVDITAPQTTVHGPLTVTGPFAFQAGMSGQGGSGAAATITGNITVTSGEITVDGIGHKSHHHTAQGNTAPTTAAQA